MTTTIRSRKVRRILRLEAQANRQATREARAAARATRLQRRVEALRTKARALEASLNGAQRAELGRARTGPVASTTPPPRVRRPSGADPRCPFLPGEPALDPESQEV